MTSPPHYTILDESRWRAAYEAAQRLVQRRGQVGRNDPCPCGSGAKYKRCCSQAETPLAQSWLDGEDRLSLPQAEQLDAESARMMTHVARMERAQSLLRKNGSLDGLPREPVACEWATLAGELRADGPSDALADLLDRILELPLDLDLDYQAVVEDLVDVHLDQGRVEAALRAQRWWVDFLEDFGKTFRYRVEAVEEFHRIQVAAGLARGTREELESLKAEMLGAPASASRQRLYGKIRALAQKDGESPTPGPPQQESP